MEDCRMAMNKTLAVLTAVSLGGCLGQPQEPASDGVHVGVLLPYTGALATIGQNLERAVVRANERLAAGERDPGKPPFRLVFRDTHSDDRKGMAAVTDLMDAQRVTFILGPEEPSLANSMAGVLKDRAVAISGGAVSLDAQGQTTWFRIVPTARRMSAYLAQRMKD